MVTTCFCLEPTGLSLSKGPRSQWRCGAAGVKTLTLEQLAQPVGPPLMSALQQLPKLRRLHLAGRGDLLEAPAALERFRKLRALTLERSEGAPPRRFLRPSK